MSTVVCGGWVGLVFTHIQPVRRGANENLRGAQRRKICWRWVGVSHFLWMFFFSICSLTLDFLYFFITIFFALVSACISYTFSPISFIYQFVSFRFYNDYCMHGKDMTHTRDEIIAMLCKYTAAVFFFFFYFLARDGRIKPAAVYSHTYISLTH